METTTVARVTVAAGDPDATDQAAQKLMKELHELNEVVAVEQAAAAGTAEGARSAEAIAIGTMLLTLAATPEVIGAVLTYLGGWLHRPGNRGTIRFRVGDREIELTDATPAERKEIIDAFVRGLRRR